MNITGQLTVIVILLAAVRMAAQPIPAAIQQQEQIRRFEEQKRPLLTLEKEETAPELYPGENEDVGPQRILSVKPRRKQIEAAVDSQYFYSSNILLAEDATGGALFINTAHLAWAPDPFETRQGFLAPRVGFRHQWYNYGLDGQDNQFEEFDFAAQTLFAENVYRFSEHWQAILSLDATRLLDQAHYHEFYKELVPGWGLQRLFPLTDRQLIALGYRGYYHFTEVDPPSASTANDRHDHILSVVYSLELMPRLYLQPYYRFQYTGYTGDLRGGSRNDFLQSVGMTLSYWFNQWAGIRTFVSYEHKESDDNPATPDYRKLDAGGGLSLVLRF